MIYKVLGGNAYHLKDLDGEIHIRSINGQFLKPYYPSMWESYETDDGIIGKEIKI